MIAFIILHYQSIEDTLNCIYSIKKMNNTDDIRIVLIDNNSPNGTGDKLRKRFQEDEQIEVILNDDNIGFSRANNIGCEYARDKWNPDFYVVANNDIVFEQNDFAKRVSEIYDKHKFYILGPDIYNIRTKKHQSPMGLKAPTLNRSRMTVALNKVCLLLYPLTYPLMKIWFKRLRENAKDVEGYDREQCFIYLQGACVIFSRDYVNERPKVYYPETRFFAEEAIFTRWCEINNKKTVYSPEIKVNHNESAATYSEKDTKQRIRFQMQNILDATNIYLAELGRETDVRN